MPIPDPKDCIRKKVRDNASEKVLFLLRETSVVVGKLNRMRIRMLAAPGDGEQNARE